MPSDQLLAATAAFLERMGPIPSDVGERRARADAARQAPPPPGVTCSAEELAGVRCEWVAVDGGDPDKVVICLHFGGFIAGNPESMRRFEATLARAVGARCLGVAYRLAPEHPFPAAWHDVVAVYRELLVRGLAPDDIAIGGASAGAGLAVGALLAIRDAGLPRPAAAFAISPWADMTLTSSTATAVEDIDPVAPPEELPRLAAMVLAGADPLHPWASPVHADLRGLPPLVVEVGTRERLLDDAIALGAAAEAAGVPVSLTVTDGAIHCFPLHTLPCPEADEAVARIVTHLRDRLLST